VITTWVHHLADALTAGRITGHSEPGEYSNTMLDQCAAKGSGVTKVPLFVVQTDARDLFSPILVRHARDTWSGLPFPDMLVELPVSYLSDPASGGPNITTRWIIRAEEEDDHLLIEAYTCDHEIEYWCIGYGVVEFWPTRITENYRHYKPPNLIPHFEDTVTKNMRMAVSFLMTFIGLLNTPAIATEVRAAPVKLNKARAKRHRAEIPTYTAITLRLPKRKHGERESSSYPGRASPRTHWRAGHQREYQPGKYAAIPPTLIAYSGEGEPPIPKYNVIIDTERTQS
jgi:hypothetical protein